MSQYSYAEATHRIVLSGQFADVTEEWIAEVDGQDEYQILLVAGDAEGIMTRLECRVTR